MDLSMNLIRFSVVLSKVLKMLVFPNSLIQRVRSSKISSLPILSMKPMMVLLLILDMTPMQKPGKNGRNLPTNTLISSVAMTWMFPVNEFIKDQYGRWWPYPINELCPTCKQPDNCGDCNHQRLPDTDVGLILNGVSDE